MFGESLPQRWQVFSAKGDMVECATAIGSDFAVSQKVIQVLLAAGSDTDEMHDGTLAAVEPVTGKIERRSETFFEPEHIDVEVPGLLERSSANGVVVESLQGHDSAGRNKGQGLLMSDLQKLYKSTRQARSKTANCRNTRVTEQKAPTMWKTVEFLYLNHQEVHDMRPPYAEIVELCEVCFRDHAAGTADMPPKIRVTPRDEMYVHAKPGYLPSFDVAGIKWQSNVEENPANGLPNNIGLVVLTNPDDGSPRAVMDCSWVTALRTPAAAMTALKYLKPADSRVACIIGLGLQGRCHFDALLETGFAPDLETVQIFDLRPEAIDSFADFVREKSNIQVVKADRPETAVRGSDIIISCTQFKKNSDPQIIPEWVKAGSLALPADVGSYWTPEGRDLMDKIYTDDIPQTESFADYGFFQGQSVRLDAEIGRVVIGEIEGRQSDDERLMCINAGLSLYDVALAQRIYERALERGVGTRLPW